MVKIIVHGAPVALARPRVAKVRAGMGERVRVYDGQKKIKRQVRCEILKQIAREGHLALIREPIAVKMDFYTPIPISVSQKRREAMEGKPDERMTDLDNYIKFYGDVMNGLIYSDDRYVCQIVASKVYSSKPRTEIKITPYGA